MSKEIIIKVSNNINRFIDKCIRYKIDLINIKYLDKDNILVRVKLDDLERIKKINYFCEIVEYKLLGLDRLIAFFKRNWFLSIIIIICFILMNFLENVICDINIIHSNKAIVELVKRELNENDIKLFTMAKSFNELEEIKLKIIEDNPNTLEWMSITKVGMKYIIRVEERIITEIGKKEQYCHIVAKKNGVIKSIKSTSGEIVPATNDYVRAGDILISGQIHLYEEVKDNICASGEVFAEVWYSVNLSIPLEYQEKVYTGEERYNFIVNKKRWFKNKYSLFTEVDIYKLNIFDVNIKYVKEKEYKDILKKYTYEEAIEEALKQVDIKMNAKLKDNGEIISKKILKKTQFNSRIDIEVFVIALENIAESQNFIVEGENIDTE